MDQQVELGNRIQDGLGIIETRGKERIQRAVRFISFEPESILTGQPLEQLGSQVDSDLAGQAFILGVKLFVERLTAGGGGPNRDEALATFRPADPESAG